MLEYEWATEYDTRKNWKKIQRNTQREREGERGRARARNSIKQRANIPCSRVRFHISLHCDTSLVLLHKHLQEIKLKRFVLAEPKSRAHGKLTQRGYWLPFSISGWLATRPIYIIAYVLHKMHNSAGVVRAVRTIIRCHRTTPRASSAQNNRANQAFELCNERSVKIWYNGAEWKVFFFAFRPDAGAWRGAIN